jgi:hypothetical protein
VREQLELWHKIVILTIERLDDSVCLIELRMKVESIVCVDVRIAGDTNVATLLSKDEMILHTHTHTHTLNAT